jgi:Peptidase inhibitor family I36
MRRLSIRGITAGLAMAAMASLGVGLAAGPASASGNIDGWHPTGCHNYGEYYCLWYSPYGEGAGWGSSASSTDIISATFGNISGGAGQGQPVRNNAASMSNGTLHCHVTTWVDPHEQGAYNWLDADWGGNLTSQLRNNEASININTCS